MRCASSHLHNVSSNTGASILPVSAAQPHSLTVTSLYGSGIDLAHIPRFRASLTSYGDRLLAKMMHPLEITEFNALPAWDGDRRARFVASRWAAKEALTKALNVPGRDKIRLLFPEMRVARPSTGSSPAPILELSGDAAEHLTRLSLAPPRLSLTHDGDYAAAVVTVERVATLDIAALVRAAVAEELARVRGTSTG
jgi:holo-[acyl-carrier protein] synthase